MGDVVAVGFEEHAADGGIGGEAGELAACLCEGFGFWVLGSGWLEGAEFLEELVAGGDGGGGGGIDEWEGFDVAEAGR